MATMAPPAVTVAIPVYNSAATLERCIRSAMSQTLEDIEILVADDCSTDDGAALAHGLAAQDPRVTVIAISPNQGKPHAMNRMAAVARGTWLAVLDADDAFHPERLERLVAAGEAAGVEMAADNLVYVDGGVDMVVRTAFDQDAPHRLVLKADLLSHSNSYAEFDFGILKPIMRLDFLRQHGLTYYEHTRLAEDFYYLLGFFVAGGRGVLLAAPLYYWTMPFGAISRLWTETGSGAWRYDYRQALAANTHFIGVMAEKGEADVVAMLQARSRQYRAMVHYLDAQRQASEGAWVLSFTTIALHPSSYGLLLRRIIGRIGRGLARPQATSQLLPTHPSLRGHAPAKIGAGP